MRPRRPAFAFVLTALLVVLAASGCKRNKQVPFGLEAPEATGGTAGDASGSGGTAGNGETAQPTAGTVFPPGHRELVLGDKALVMQEAIALAAFETDLDGDDSNEAFVVTSDAGQTTLSVASPTVASISLRKLASFSVPPRCVGPGASIVAMSDSLLRVAVHHRCAEGRRDNHWIVTREASPRVLERLTVLPGTAGQTATADFAAADHDADGRDDLRVRFGDTLDTEAPAPQLVWLDRPNGFARDQSEPETSIAALAAEASKLVGTDDPRARALAETALIGFRSLCRESADARISTSGTLGVQCGQSRGTANAVAVLVRIFLNENRFVQALDAESWLDHEGVAGDAYKQAVHAAWQSAATPASLKWTTFKNGDTSTGPPPPQVARLDAVLRLGAFAVHDAEDRFGVKRVQQDPRGSFCGPVKALISSKPTDPPLSWIAPVAGAPKPKPTCCEKGQCSDQRMWKAIGWAPQGLLMARGTTIRLVPLNTQLRSIGTQRDVSATQTLPAPIVGTTITPNGSHHAITTSHGIVVHHRPTETSVLLRPPSTGPAAIAPDGQALALRTDDALLYAEW